MLEICCLVKLLHVGQLFCFTDVYDSSYGNRSSNCQLSNSELQYKRTGNTLILFHNLRFAFNGSIERWSGSLGLNSLSLNSCEKSGPLLFLQIWRPSEEESSTFSLVGSSPLSLSADVDEAIEGENFTTFIVNKSVEEDCITFQQDDIVGIYVASHVAEAILSCDPDLMADNTATMMKDIVFPTSQAPCKVSYSDNWIEPQPRLPTILPHCFSM